MGKKSRKNAVVGQSGGPTAVINQSLVGVIETFAEYDNIDRIFGARYGVRGIIEENFINLDGLDTDLLERIADTPCAALGSTRDKPDEEYCRKIFNTFAKNDVRYFFYIGGNDSADTARIISEMADDAGYELAVFHIPKTIDNDLLVTDHCPGYGSAARFVEHAVMGDGLDNASLPGIKIDVIMGRHAGWLTAASMLARRDENDAPHLIYVPESPISEEQFVDDIAKVYDRLGRCLVVVSEGIMDENGGGWNEQLLRMAHGAEVERDGHGNVQLSGSGMLGDCIANFARSEVATRFGNKKLRVRADTFGYLQRSFPDSVSPVDRSEARLAGRTAVEYAAAGQPSGSVAFRRLGDGDNYGIECFRAELKDVACNTKSLPAKYINEAGNGITEQFRNYAAPLVGELPVIGKL